MSAAIAAMTPAAAQAATAGPTFGTNIQSIFEAPNVTTLLASVQRSRIALGREEIGWWTVEPNAPVNGQHSYSWSWWDSRVAAMAARGIRWFPSLTQSTLWATTVPGNVNAPPTDPADFAAFAAAFAHRYGRNGSFWAANKTVPYLPVTSYEIWNEPNIASSWANQATAPALYADLFAAAQAAIRGVDPAATVVAGSLSSNTNTAFGTPPGPFLLGMMTHRPTLKPQALSVHPYASTPAAALYILQGIRWDMDVALGAYSVSTALAGVPIVVSEFGWSSYLVPEATRAKYMSDMVGLLTSNASALGLTTVLVHTWVTPSTFGPIERGYAIANIADGSLQPAGQAYVSAISRLRGLPPALPRASAIPEPTNSIAMPTRRRSRVRRHG